MSLDALHPGPTLAPVLLNYGIPNETEENNHKVPLYEYELSVFQFKILQRIFFLCLRK